MLYNKRVSKEEPSAVLNKDNIIIFPDTQGGISRNMEQIRVLFIMNGLLKAREQQSITGKQQQERFDADVDMLIDAHRTSIEQVKSNIARNREESSHIRSTETLQIEEANRVFYEGLRRMGMTDEQVYIIENLRTTYVNTVENIHQSARDKHLSLSQERQELQRIPDGSPFRKE